MASLAWASTPAEERAGIASEAAGVWDARAVRFVDITASLALLIFLAPLLLLVAMLVFITNPGPVIFGHVRIGQHGRSFRCLKFRSMVVDAQERLVELLAHDAEARIEWERDHKLRNDPRITMIGGFLRRTSLDELPQLFNVLRGEMSLVGPRPIVEAEVKRYGRYFGHYKKVRPGITGLWQVSGRSDTSYRRRVAMDVAYTKAKSFRLYWRILIMTVPSVLMSKGSY